MDNTSVMGLQNSDLQLRFKAICEKLKKSIVVKSEKITGFTFCECDYKEGSAFPDLATMTPFAPTQRWGGKRDSHAWFYIKLDIKDNAPYRTELRVDTQKDGWDASNPQFMLYINGVLTQGMDVNHRTAVINESGEKEIFLYAYTGTDIDDLLDFNASIELIDEEMEKLYYNLFVPYSMLSYNPLGSKDYNEILLALNEAVNLLDLRKIGSDECNESVKRANEFLTKRFYSTPCTDREVPRTSCFGHTHIDLAWLWQKRQTVEKAQRSFATMDALLSRYPDFKFTSSQVPLYKMVKKENPHLYDRIKQHVASGRWEPEGGMYVEADCNVTGGESLVRQFMYGKGFFKREFNVDSKILWLPDVFGYSAALPQILSKCGINDFVTSKISWNDSNQMPYDIFRWRGIDGTEILTHFITGQTYNGETYKFSTYVGQATPAFIRGTYERYTQKIVNKNAIATIGYGDGGGGTTPSDCEMVTRQNYAFPAQPVAEWTSLSDYMKEVHKRADGNKFTPLWSGELYLEFHRGTYTSQAKNKLGNRKSEFLLQNVETLAVINANLGANLFNKDKHDEAWEKVLFNQFHDILPGSSINGVYRDTDEDYAQISAYGLDAIKAGLNNIASKVKGKGLLVFNPNGYAYTGSVTVNGKRYFVENIPAKGYAVVPYKEATTSKVKYNNGVLENDYYALTFDENMDIVSLYDKVKNRELLKKDKSIRFVAYQDIPYEYDAWELCMYYPEKEYALSSVTSVKEIVDGDRKGVEVTRSFGSSTITDKIFLYDDKRLIEFCDDADWHEEQTLLKRVFPLDLISDKATCEIQFGTVERPTHQNTSWDKAKFEVCAHKFVDISESDYGVALINESKYGHGLVNNDISLSLLRSPKYPDESCDMGAHSFSYALYPHEGALAQSDTQIKAIEFNNPVIAIDCAGGDGTLPPSYSAVISTGALVIDTVKPCEDGDGFIIRAYEPMRKKGTEILSLGSSANKAYLCDMLENELTELTVTDGKITLPFKPFEILTIKVK